MYEFYYQGNSKGSICLKTDSLEYVKELFEHTEKYFTFDLPRSGERPTKTIYKINGSGQRTEIIAQEVLPFIKKNYL